MYQDHVKGQQPDKVHHGLPTLCSQSWCQGSWSRESRSERRTLTQFTMDYIPCAVSIGVNGVGEESQSLKCWHSHAVHQVWFVVGLQKRPVTTKSKYATDAFSNGSGQKRVCKAFLESNTTQYSSSSLTKPNCSDQV